MTLRGGNVEVYTKSSKVPHTFVVRSGKTEHICGCQSPNELQEWIAAIKSFV